MLANKIKILRCEISLYLYPEKKMWSNLWRKLKRKHPFRFLWKNKLSDEFTSIRKKNIDEIAEVLRTTSDDIALKETLQCIGTMYRVQFTACVNFAKLLAARRDVTLAVRAEFRT